MIHELVLTNARVVTPEAVLPGTVVARDGLIAAVEPGGPSPPVPSTSTATGSCRALSSCTPTILSGSSRRGPACAGRRMPPC